MGWTGMKKCYRVEVAPDRCVSRSCDRMPTHGCQNMVRGVYVCELHKSSCCKPLKVGPIYRSPLMQLGSWVFANKNCVENAPEDLLLAAYAHVEARLVRCAHGNARARATERWLGRWARLIDGELARQARGHRVANATWVTSAPAGGLAVMEFTP